MFRGGTLQSLPAIEGNPAVVEISAYGQTVLARTAEGRVWAFSTGSGSWAEWTSNLVRVSRLSAGLGTAFAFTVAPHLFSPPSPATVSVGTPVQLAVGATSTSPLQYQSSPTTAPP
jgi:hypothetical protein